MIEAINLCKSVETQSGVLPILQGINLKINKGETVALVGASGSGKTSLLGLLAGLDRPSQGEVKIDGQTLDLMGEEERAALRGEKVGFVFQSFQLIPAFTALENTVLPLEITQRKVDRAWAEQLLRRVGLAERLHHTPPQLSGGEQQRVAIARAFVAQPEFLFADEPTGNLDKKTGKMVMDLLFELNETQGSTLVLVTHDDHLADRCQRKLVIDDGRLQ